MKNATRTILNNIKALKVETTALGLQMIRAKKAYHKSLALIAQIDEEKKVKKGRSKLNMEITGI